MSAVLEQLRDFVAVVEENEPVTGTELVQCSTAWCYEKERSHIAWWLPQASVPLCDRCYERWCRVLGFVRLT